MLSEDYCFQSNIDGTSQVTGTTDFSEPQESLGGGTDGPAGVP